MLDVLVVGAGQAGLAIGHSLARQELDFLIVDGATEVGQSWRSRWDSLVLFTPAQFDCLPGMPFPADADTYPTKEATAAYLSAYAERFALPIELGSRVNSVTGDPGRYIATIGSDAIEAKHVVVATGPFQTPFIPPVSRDADATMPQPHSAEYRRPDDLPLGPVLVVGGANSGCQIARELAHTRPVELAIGDRVPALPQRLLGKDVWWWGRKLGVASATIESRLGKRLSRRDPVIGTGPRALARRHGIRLRPRVTSVAGSSVTFSDGATAEPDSILWATGFRGDYGWIRVAGVLDGEGRPLHRRGVTRAEGFYFLGLTWLWTRGSGLLGWVGNDASYLANRISASRTM